jgi:hypothetical protein
MAMRGRGTYHQSELPIFILADARSDDSYVLPAKAADQSTIRLLLADHQQVIMGSNGSGSIPGPIYVGTLSGSFIIGEGVRGTQG